MADDGGVSSLQSVGDLVRMLKSERRLPTDEEMRAVRPELARLQQRVERVRSLGPEFAMVNLSDEVWALVKLSEKPSLSEWSRSILKRIAATFLW